MTEAPRTFSYAEHVRKAVPVWVMPTSVWGSGQWWLKPGWPQPDIRVREGIVWTWQWRASNDVEMELLGREL